MASAASDPDWTFSQVFGERVSGEDVQEVDLISTVDFEKKGDYIATGDHGGRVVIFERTDRPDERSRKELEQLDCSNKRHPEYRYKTEFQSHEPEFDYLKSVEIEEKINKVRWCTTSGGLTQAEKCKEMDQNTAVSSENMLLAEKSFVSEQLETSVPNGYHLEWTNKTPRSIFHHLKSSRQSDGETFVSADDLRINMWNLEFSNQCFNIIDMKPSDMEDLTALCDQNARILQDREAHGSKSFFTEIVASISDMKFASDGRHILSRDYMNLKLWDLNMEASPIATYKIHDYLRPKLHDLYNNDSIFDKFDCCFSSDGLQFATGSYGNLFRVFTFGDRNEGITLEATRSPNRKQVKNQNQPRSRRASLSNITRGQFWRANDNSSSDSSALANDLTAKMLHLAWHPTSKLIACAAANSLYLYHA
ncbi:hypothetical protein Sjap_023551 [Stephania japonica]|uniref:Serine/threonine-protein phosphatase 2A 55 kDa regulatory subunit B n=1 Tax=Stephania japonica TaxID=461633 RepID=A0AAP0HKK6_9MAGN